MTGELDICSYMDGLQRSKDVCKVRETCYSLVGSKLRIRSHTHSTPVVRNGREKRLLFNLATTSFPEVFATDNHLDMAMLSDLEETFLARTLSDSCSISDANSLYLARDRLHQYISKLFYLLRLLKLFS